MNIQTNILTCLFIAILISGCATTPNSPDSYDPKVFSAGQKGVVIMRVTQHAPKTLNNTDISQSYGLRRIGGDKVYYVNENNSFIPGVYNAHDYSSSIMMLDPGIYYIDSLSLNDKGNLRRWYPSPGIALLSKKDGVKKYFVRRGAFEVKAGQILYLGYLKLPDSGKFPFQIINEVDKAKTDLRKNGLTDISDKIQFQQFYQAGSILIESNGKFTVITREEMEPRIKQYVEKAKQHFEEITSPK